MSSYHHGDLRRALIDAALEILITEGTQALSLRAVARRAGVSQAAPYHHFTDRDELLAAVAVAGFRLMLSQLENVRTAPSPNPRKGMEDCAVAYVHFAMAYPSHYRLMFGRALAERSQYVELRDSMRELRAVFAETVVKLQQRGLARRGDPAELGLTVWSLLHGLAMLLIDGQMREELGDACDADRLIRDQTALLLHGMVYTSSMSAPPSVRGRPPQPSGAQNQGSSADGP
jgi:AcrR family transcriptional regulator